MVPSSKFTCSFVELGSIASQVPKDSALKDSGFWGSRASVVEQVVRKMRERFIRALAGESPHELSKNLHAYRVQLQYQYGIG